jgi:tetratricopeptide (TPR) repeat protein
MQIKSYIDDDLRRRPTSPKKLAVALEQEREAVDKMRRLAQDDPSELNSSHLGRELSRLADHLLLAERPDEALPLKEEAVDIWRELGRDKAVFLAELDATEMVFEMASDLVSDLARREQAVEELDRLVEASELEALEVYRDFALEVRARCLARLGEIERARDDLDETLELRRSRGNARQIEQTERLIGLIAAL